jgi:hypothetical protein
MPIPCEECEKSCYSKESNSLKCTLDALDFRLCPNVDNEYENEY